MCVRALDGNVKELSAQDIGCSHAACNDCRASAVGSRVGTLGTAKTELHDSVAAGRIADTRRLRGDQALVVDDVEDRGLHELCLHDRGNDLDHRLSGEHERAFGDRVDRTCEFEVFKVVEKILIKNAETAKVVDILLAEMQLLDVFDQLFGSAHDRIAAAEGIGSEERVEDNRIVLFLILKISLHHGELIQICEQCQVLSVHNYSSRSLKR